MQQQWYRIESAAQKKGRLGKLTSKFNYNFKPKSPNSITISNSVHTSKSGSKQKPVWEKYKDILKLQNESQLHREFEKYKKMKDNDIKFKTLEIGDEKQESAKSNETFWSVFSSMKSHTHTSSADSPTYEKLTRSDIKQLSDAIVHKNDVTAIEKTLLKNHDISQEKMKSFREAKCLDDEIWKLKHSNLHI